MAMLERYAQSADEKLRYGIDYSQWLEPGEAVESVSFESQPSGMVFDGEEILTGNAVIFYASGGVSCQKYRVVVRVETSLQQVREDEVIFTIE